jgi:hypothetical protein
MNYQIENLINEEIQKRAVELLRKHFFIHPSITVGIAAVSVDSEDDECFTEYNLDEFIASILDFDSNEEMVKWADWLDGSSRAIRDRVCYNIENPKADTPLLTAEEFAERMDSYLPREDDD